VDRIEQRAPRAVEWVLWLWGTASLALHVAAVAGNLGVVWVRRFFWRGGLILAGAFFISSDRLFLAMCALRSHGPNPKLSNPCRNQLINYR
jgi:hypothetical protein